jgi:hypothetical protein
VQVIPVTWIEALADLEEPVLSAIVSSLSHILS